MVLLLLPAAALRAAAEEPPEIRITRTAGSIEVDGDLSDPGWKDATKVDTFFETNPGDNVPPRVRSVAYLAYDDKFLYAGFEFFDPDPSKIRSPYGDRDDVPSYTDYGGIILDTRNDHRTGLLLLANPRGIQYDAITDDTTGNEDSSPDFYWDSAAKITKEGWVLEMRVPFSSLRYPRGDKQTWGILLYRNYPREFRYQMFSSKLPRGGNCFICRSNHLTGLDNLPPAGHLVVAPYVTAKEDAVPSGDLGSPLVNKPVRFNGGVDAKWTPNENNAIDATLNPDFSQVESDVAQIATNQRFALFYPEKRPFFLEGLELFSSPIQAVYTRSITSPRWGIRATGKFDSNQYTAFVAEDRGGGSVILPGPNGSSFADQDFSSFVAMARVRHDFGKSFVSFLGTDREIEGGGYNRVYGPDFQWRAGDHDTVTGQVLVSNTETPNRPDLSDQWTGQKLNSYAADVWYQHSTTRWDWFTELRDFGDGFRADDGFVPQVGYRENYGEAGYTIRPEKFPISRLRTFLQADYQAETDGSKISSSISPGIGMDGMWNSFTRLRYADDRVRSGNTVLPRRQLVYQFQVSPPALGHAVPRPGDGRRADRLRQLAPRDRGRREPAGHDPADRPFEARPRRGQELGQRRSRRRRRLPAPLHRGRGKGESRLHVHGARVPPVDRAGRGDAARSLALHVRGDPEGLGVHGLGPLRLQDQLADGDVPGIRRQPDVHRRTTTTRRPATSSS